MNDGPRGPIRVSHLSVGFQLLLVLILIGSCSGGSERVTNTSSTDTAALRQQVQRLETEVRALRQDLRHQRKQP
jgi:outer membrane murein-binding lipoprotein Lpp